MRRTLLPLLPALAASSSGLFVLALALLTMANAWKGR
jgi:hypothetical protein